MKFNEIKTSNPNKYNNLMIVDSLNLAFRWKHIHKTTFASEYINTINSLAKSYEAKRIIVVGDRGSKWRKDRYPEYKRNREKLRENQTQEELEEFKEFLNELDNALKLLEMNNITVFKFSGVEADDIAAYIVKTAKNDYTHIWLISSDKDWDILLSDKVSRFSYVTRKEYKMDNFIDHYGYPQEMHLSIKVLTGDKGDNVAGINGVGEKRAYNILKNYGPSALDVLDQLPIDSKYKYIKELNKFNDKILTNYELMDLLTYCELSIGEESLNIIRENL